MAPCCAPRPRPAHRDRPDRRSGCLGPRCGLGFHLGLRTLDQCGHVVGQIGVGLSLMAKHLIDELTQIAGMSLRRLVDGIEIEPINLRLRQHGADTAEGDQ
jgi:nucleotidyltransferase/DNA polymerase involved in DNA repair